MKSLLGCTSLNSSSRSILNNSIYSLNSGNLNHSLNSGCLNSSGGLNSSNYSSSSLNSG